ncbi:TPA: fimbria/pilus periplasmic chaperone [Enterobacter cancerogenus]
MSGNLLRDTLCAIVISASTVASFQAAAGGITLGATRVIYSAGQKQSTMSVRNTSDQASFMVQSWVEDANGNKSQDFIVTPPLYVSGPGNENTLRLMYAGKPVRTDQETLYYFNTKSIPSIDKKKMEGTNILMVAAVTRIKLFVRPHGLKPAIENAPAELSFHKVGNQVRIENPTPYHITLAQIRAGTHKLPDTMVGPRNNITLPLPAGDVKTIDFRTINDFGAATPVISAVLK